MPDFGEINPAGSFLSNYIASRTARINRDRQQEEQERNAKIISLQHTIENADKLNLTPDDLRVLYNQVGDALGHKPDPKFFGIIPGANKGSKGSPGLGDMLYPEDQRNAQSLNVASAPPLTAQAPDWQKNLEQQIGPPPTMIQPGQREGSIPVAQLQTNRALQSKLSYDQAQTANDIATGKYDKQVYNTDDNGNLQLRILRPNMQSGRYEDVTDQQGLTGANVAAAKAKIQTTAEVKAQQRIREITESLKGDPANAGKSDAELDAMARKKHLDEINANLAKATSKTEENLASAGLKRARTQDLLHPELRQMTPYQSASLGIQQQRVELDSARNAIAQGKFDADQSKPLVGDMKSFYTMRANALKLIDQGNQLRDQGKDENEYKAKWAQGYAMLGQAKVMAKTMAGKYPGMINVAGTDTNNNNEYPWIEANAPAKKQGASPSTSPSGGKRPFNPSPQVKAPAMTKDQYIQALRAKNIPEDKIQQQVQKYYPGQ